MTQRINNSVYDRHLDHWHWATDSAGHCCLLTYVMAMAIVDIHGPVTYKTLTSSYNRYLMIIPVHCRVDSLLAEIHTASAGWGTGDIKMS